MSQLECPSCKLKIRALGAPQTCPRCLVRKGERIEFLFVAATPPAGQPPSPPMPPPSSAPLRR
jgi:hypothetical protein